MQPCVYILSNDNNTTLYIGVTSDLVQRVAQHHCNEGNAFTYRYGLHKLVFFEYHATMISAISREKQLKSWSRKRKVELIEKINPLWLDLMSEDYN